MSITSTPVHAYPECESIWLKLIGNDQVVLLEAGSLIFKDPERKLGQFIPYEHLLEFEGKGVLFQENGEWQFTVPQLLLFIQSIGLIDSFTLISQPANELVQWLSEFQHGTKGDPYSSFKERKMLVAFLIVRLVNNLGRADILDYFISEEIENHLFWSFYDPVCDAMPILVLSTEKLINVFKQVVNRTKGDFAGGMIFTAAEYIGLFRPELAFDLVDLMTNTEDWETGGILEKLLTGAANSSADCFSSVITTCESWLNHDYGNERLCRLAISCPKNLILSGKLEPNWLLSRVGPLIVQSSDNSRYTLTVAICELGAMFQEWSGDCLDILSQLKVREFNGNISHGVAVALAHRDDVAIEYRVSCLSFLVDVPIKNRGTIREISWFLYSLAHLHPEIVWRYLEEWIQTHEVIEANIVEHDMFLSTIQDVFETDMNGGIATLTKWFASPDQRFVEEARLIIDELKVLNLAPQEIASMPPHIIQYITEKLLIGHLESNHLMMLFYCIMRDTTWIEELKDYFLKVLRYLTRNYSGSSPEFFTRVIKEDDTHPLSILLKKARQEFEEYRSRRRDKFIPELAPSKQRIARFQEFERKKMQETQKKVKDSDRYPLQKLVSWVIIGRGNRTFHMNVFHPDPAQIRTFDEPRGFGHFSKSIELPRGEIIDPEGEIEQRIRRHTYTPEDFLKNE